MINIRFLNRTGTQKVKKGNGHMTCIKLKIYETKCTVDTDNTES